MGLWSYLFPNAGEVQALTQQCKFYINQVEHLETKIVLLEKEVKAERRAKDRMQGVLLDQVAQAFKLRPGATKALESKKEPEELPP